MQEGTGAETELDMIEMSIETATKKVNLGEALNRLRKNKDFKLLILDHFMGDYALQLVMNKASYGMQDDRNQKFVDDQISAVGHLDQYLRFTAQEGYVAKEAIEADKATRQEILAEEL